MPVPGSVSMLTLALAAGLLAGCGSARQPGDGPGIAGEPDTQPCASQPGAAAAGDQEGTEKPSKRIWADSLLFCDAPPLAVRTWLSQQPALEGRFVLIEFWRTWCGACRRTVPLLNSFHEKYGQELVVIAITGEPEETVRAYAGPHMDYAMAIDQPGTKGEADEPVKDQGATEEGFGVWGWPHVVLLEPEHRCVIWEGFPLLKGYELTAEKIEHALAIGRQRQAGK